MAGAPERVRAEWSGPAAGLDAPALQAAAADVRARHGALVDAVPSRSRNLPLKPRPGKAIATVPITITFERGAVEADLGLELFDERTGSTVMRWRSLRVIEPDGNDFIFPPGEPPPEPLGSGNPPADGKSNAATPAQPSRPAPPPLP
jgi:hypothetical protein